MNTQLKIPGLQRVTQRKCIVCGAGADLFCARCLVTPYCSVQCQRRDWASRHNSVCHNLMRLQSAGKTSSHESADGDQNYELPAPPPPLRRPRSPPASRDQTQRNRVQPANSNKVSAEPQRGRGQATHYNNTNRTVFSPPDHHPQPMRTTRGGCARPAVIPDHRRPRQNQNNNDNADDEEWGNEIKTQKSTPKPQNESFRAPKPQDKDIRTPKPQTEFSAPKPQTGSPVPKIESPKEPASIKSDVFKSNARMGANLGLESPVHTVTRPTDVALVPSQYLIEKLPIGETFVLSVEREARECATKQPGFVCIAMHADYQEQFNMLLGDIWDGETPYEPQVGATFAYLDASDEGWYRARRVSRGRCALLDAGRAAPLAPAAAARCRALAPRFADIPEFCCVLNGNAKVNMSLKCTILMKTPEGFKVSLDAYTEDAYLGEGIITRWIPEVEVAAAPQEKIQPAEEKTKPPPTPEKIQPQPETCQPIPEKSLPTRAVPAAAPIPEKKSQPPSSASIPSVPRPAIAAGGRYLLTDVTSLSRACVRPCDEDSQAEFEAVLQDTALYGIQNGKPLTESPLPGQLVLCQYDGVHYRALVTRTKAADNRYKVEYIEYGNEEIVPLEKLFACPPELDLSSRAARASIVALSTIVTAELTPPATEYIETLKEQAELIASIPNGEKTVPSGSLVQLSLAKNKESVNKKLEAMCTPEWKKLEEGGGDVMESAVMLFPDMKTLPLPTERPFTMDVTDFSNLETGVVCGFENGAKEAEYVYGQLTEKINEYCKSELCSEPYLPMVEELCIARLPPYPQWFRAVVVEHKPGAATAAILYTDYGNVEAEVPVSDLRKCMPEFARDPAVAATADIKDWPKPATSEQIVRAIEFLRINEDGRGQLPVTRCTRIEEDLAYIIEVPDLIAAINAV